MIGMPFCRSKTIWTSYNILPINLKVKSFYNIFQVLCRFAAEICRKTDENDAAVWKNVMNSWDLFDTADFKFLTENGPPQEYVCLSVPIWVSCFFRQKLFRAFCRVIWLRTGVVYSATRIRKSCRGISTENVLFLIGRDFWFSASSSFFRDFIPIFPGRSLTVKFPFPPKFDSIMTILFFCFQTVTRRSLWLCSKTLYFPFAQ